MFRKRPTIKPAAPLRSSDRRKHAQQFLHILSIPAPADGEPTLRNSLLPDGTRIAKFNTTAGPDLDPVHGTFYIADDGRPLWVRVDRHTPETYPTVYTLWANSGIQLLPVLKTHRPVLEKIFQGADLMVPGLVGPPFPEGAARGRLVAVVEDGRDDVPLAVGVCEIDVKNLAKAIGEKGKAVKILHYVGDEVYKQGGALAVVPERLGRRVNELENVGTLSIEEIPEKAEEDTGGEKIRELPVKEVDDAFNAAALYGFYDHLTNKRTENLDFPLSSSTFISTLVYPYLPPAAHFPPHNLLQSNGPHPSLVLKKTSWKSVGKFLKHLEKGNLVQVKVRGGGEVVVLDINWDSELVCNFEPYKLPTPLKDHPPSAPVSAAPLANIFTVKALYRPKDKAARWLEEAGANPKDFFTAAQIRDCLNSYVSARALISQSNKRLIKLDPALSNYLYDKPPAPEVPRDSLSERLITLCAPYYTVTSPSGDTSKPKSGPLPQIMIVTGVGKSNKHITKISGLEAFGLVPKALAEELQRLCAGSATVGQAVGAKPGLMEVQVQGSQSETVVKVLGQKGIPKKLVTVVNKEKKGKGRREN